MREQRFREMETLESLEVLVPAAAATAARQASTFTRRSTDASAASSQVRRQGPSMRRALGWAMSGGSKVLGHECGFAIARGSEAPRSCKELLLGPLPPGAA